MIIHGGICAHKRVEWQWLRYSDGREGASYGDVVCYDCRMNLMYTNVPNFVEYITERKWVYMPRLHDATLAASPQEASSR